MGGFLGSKLISAGNDVAFLVRAMRREQLKREGLRVVYQADSQDRPVKDGAGELRFEVNAVTDASEINECEALIVAVKNFSLGEVMDAIRVLTASGACVISFLNGVEQMEKIRAVVSDDEKIAGGVLHLEASLDGEHVVQRGISPSVILGSPAAKRELVVQALADCFSCAGVVAKVSEDILADLWQKYIFITILSSLTGVCMAPIGPILRNPSTNSLFEDVGAEVVDVAKKAYPNLTSVPLERFLNQIRNLPENMTASLARDMRRGLPTEVEYIQGYLLRRAKELGLKVPATEFCYKILKLYEKGTPIP